LFFFFIKGGGLMPQSNFGLHVLNSEREREKECGRATPWRTSWIARYAVPLAGSLIGVTACGDHSSLTPPAPLTAEVRTSVSVGQIGSAQATTSPVTLEYGPNGFVTAVLTISSLGPDPVRLIIQEPSASPATSALQALGAQSGLQNDDGGLTGSLGGSALGAAAANRDDPAAWPKFDTLGTSLRVRSVTAGIPTALAWLSVATGDTLAVMSRRSRSAGTFVRSDYFTVQAAGQRIDVDLTGTLASVHPMPGTPLFARRASAAMFTSSVKCAKAAFSLLSPSVLSAQSPTPRDCSTQQAALDRAAETRTNTRGATAFLLAGSALTAASSGWTGVGLLLGGLGVVGAGFTYISGEAPYNWAADDLFQCQSGGSGELPPRCKGPTIGRCKPGLK
jgi:hypothetical protein